MLRFIMIFLTIFGGAYTVQAQINVDELPAYFESKNYKRNVGKWKKHLKGILNANRDQINSERWSIVDDGLMAPNLHAITSDPGDLGILCTASVSLDHIKIIQVLGNQQFLVKIGKIQGKQISYIDDLFHLIVPNDSGLQADSLADGDVFAFNNMLRVWRRNENYSYESVGAGSKTIRSFQMLTESQWQEMASKKKNKNKK